MDEVCIYIFVDLMEVGLGNIHRLWERLSCYSSYLPDSKVHGAHMGPIWGRQDPGGPHVGPMNFAIWARSKTKASLWKIGLLKVNFGMVDGMELMGGTVCS